MTDKITAYKGFDKNLKCRDFQFEIGKTYTHDGDVKKCKTGFHACEHPLSVFEFYDPAGSRFAAVEQSGTIDKDETKTASSVIEIKSELTLHDLIKAAIDFTLSRVKQTGQSSNTGDYGVASNTGYYGVGSNTGDCGVGSNTGYRGVGSNTGNYGVGSNTGTRGVASNTGTRGVASNTGDYGVAFNNGYEGSVETSGKGSVAVGVGYQNKGRASEGNWLVLAYRDSEHVIKHICSAKADGRGGIKPDVWYTLNAKGEFVEVKK